MGKTKNENIACEPEDLVLTRAEKKEKLELIYSKAVRLIFEKLGTDKDTVYAACQALQTASRELNVVEKIMRITGELEFDVEDSKQLAVYEITDQDAILEEMFASESADA
jgi:hypothetical protein